MHLRLLPVLALATACSGSDGASETEDATAPDIASEVSAETQSDTPADDADAIAPARWGPDGGGTPANIVVIVADDLGYGDVSALCDLTDCPRRIATPNIDRLGDEGLWLTQGYTTAGTCSPARAGFNSGRYQQTQGFEFNTRDFTTAVTEGRGLRPGTELLARWLGDAGYATAVIGKWHLGITSTPTPPPHTLAGIDMDLHPMRMGFDSYYGFIEGAHDYLSPDMGGDTSFVMRGFAREPHRGYLTEVLADEAVAFIERQAGAPFYLYAPFSAPHKPLQEDPALSAEVAHIANDERRAYVSMVLSLDHAVGRILDALSAAGVSEDTLVVFFSDNGALDEHFASNHPLRLGKATLFEGGVRVPFALRYPRFVPAGVVCDQVVSTLDLAPSALSAAGVDASAFDLQGMDLAEIAVAGCSAPSPREIFWRAGPNRALRSGDLKLIEATNTTLGETKRWLFDLTADPSEEVDRSASMPAEVERLRAALDAWEATLQPSRWPAQYPTDLMIDGFPYELHF